MKYIRKLTLLSGLMLLAFSLFALTAFADIAEVDYVPSQGGTATYELKFTVTLNDTDGTDDDWTWSAPGGTLPGTATFTDDGAATGAQTAEFVWDAPAVGDIGIYSLQLVYTDGVDTDSIKVRLEVSAENIVFTQYDTIANWVPQVPLLRTLITTQNGDTLTSVRLRSYIEKEYAINRIRLLVNGAEKKTVPVTGRFDENTELVIAGLNIPFDDSDEIEIQVDAWEDSVDTDTTYHLTGLELVIPEKGLVFRNGGTYDSIQPDRWFYNPSFDSSTGNAILGSPYKVIFDLYSPIFDVAVTHVDSSCPAEINVGDQLIIVISNPNEEIVGDSITVDLSAFGVSPVPYTMPLDPEHFLNLPGFASDVWTDTIRVGADNLDVLAGYEINFNATDNAGNTGTQVYQFTKPIDTIEPVIDSVTFYISQNNTGPEESAAIGDRLTLIVYMGSNGFFEIDSVRADLSNFRTHADSLIWHLDDITNGNNIWRLEFYLLDAIAVDVPTGDSTDKWVEIQAWDNSCNWTIDSTYLNDALDLEPPTFSGTDYTTVVDFDSTNCTNLGDSVRIEADLSLTSDLDSVYADFLEGGLGGNSQEVLYDDGTNGDAGSGNGIFTKSWRVGLADDPSFDPNPLDAKDANSTAIDADFTLDITAKDDAGNTTVLTSGALTQVFGGGAANMDTRRPTEINQDSVKILQLAGGKLQLKWPRTQQGEDALYFYVYVDSGDGFDFTDVFGTTFDSEYSADTNAWTSEVLTHNKNYRFVVRTQDDCGNFEFNSTIYEGVADAEAPPVCVVFPDVDLNWGPNNDLYITATTTFTDLDAAYFVYRKTDKGDGTPGPWINYPALTTKMSISGLTVRDTIDLGTALSTAGHYEAYIITLDNAGNQLTIAEADAACGPFTFYWNPQAVPVDISVIDGAFSPQSECGYDVWRDSLNWAVTNIIGGDDGPYYTFDYWVIFDSTTRYTRIEFKDTVDIPDTVWFSAADWPKSSGGFPTWFFVQVTDVRSGNMGLDSVKLCVPDEVAPKAYISSPVSYSCVPLAATSLDSLEIEVTLDPTGYDLDNPVRCEYFYTLDGTTDNAVKIGEETFSGSTSTVKWNNSALTGESYVWLYAVIHDEIDNLYQTRMVKVCIDETLPNMTLSIAGGVTYADCDGNEMLRVGNANGGVVDLVAEITSTTIDIKNVYFYIQNADSIDIFEFWNYIGSGSPANNNSIWTISFDTDVYPCGYTYRIRVAVEDNAGNWMLDFDGDGNFDDYTYPDAKSASAGMEFFHDCGAVQPAISTFMTVNGEDLTWTNPSARLGGSGKVYAKMGETLSAEAMTLPAFDSCEVARVDWYLCGEYVGSSSDQASWWKVDFDPFALGILTQQDIEDGFKSCTLTAQMVDKLGQTATDNITVYFLDTISDCPYIYNPQGGSYQWGDIDLDLFVIDDRGIKKVAWYYWVVGGDPILIEEVYYEEEASPKSKDINVALEANSWDATWHTLNAVPDGDYMIGAIITDESDNVSDINCGAINVHVVNALPTVAITSPVDGAFICDDGELFKMSVVGNAANVNVQWKPIGSSDEAWGSLINPDSDNFAPWEVLLANDTLSEGFYHFRPVAYNLAGRMVYGEEITLYIDDSNPIARLITVTDDGETFKDLEYSNDPSVSYPVGTQMLTFNLFALDTLSSDGPSAAYNSGMYQICVNYTTSGGPAAEELCFDATVDANGFVDIPWDISGLSVGTYKLTFTAYDNACGSTSMNMTLNLIRVDAPMGLIVGCWQGKIFGVTEANASVLFQKRVAGGNWIPIGISNEETGTREYLLMEDGSYTSVQYAVYWADWAPSDGDYEIRMLADYSGLFEEENSPIQTVTVADGGCTVTSNPEDYPLGSIERNKEEDCDNLEGLGFFETTYGMPYGVAVSYNVANEDYEYDLISFFTLPQQGAMTTYGGSFDFDALVYDGGFGMGRVFFADHADGVAFSTYQHYETYWVTRDFGTGGVITYVDGSVTVDIPAEWTDDTGTDASALAIWKAKMARPAVFQDYLYTPIGDNNGMMTYLTDPYCEYYCGDDEQYAIVNMQYNNTDTTPAESLAVAWWDGEGIWHTDNIWFPSTVRGFYQADGQNWVEFAVTCFGDDSTSDDAYYSVVKPTEYDGTQAITRIGIYPWCNDYTGGFPEFAYQLVEPFQSQINWSSLEVRFDGVRIFEGSDYDFGGDNATLPKSRETAVALHDAEGWYFWFDEVAARVFFYWQTSLYVDYDDYDDYWDDIIDLPKLDCGEHTVYIRVEDEQLRPQYISDVFNVDCEGPDVDFDNYYVSKNPTINFSISDVGAGVDWDEVYVDIFFISKRDTTAGGGDSGNPKERVLFMQTFFPGQIQDYMTEDGHVSITTTYELDDERAILVAIYDGHRSGYYDGNYWDVDPGAYDNFDEFYYNWGGPIDCVGNWSQPHLQILAVDYEAPVITLESSEGTCPMVFRISDDGAGFTDWGIYEDGVKLTEAVDSPSDVDEGGEYYFSPSGNGGTLYYCPSSGVSYEVIFKDNVGNEALYYDTGEGSVSPESLTGFGTPNPFDPMADGRVEIKFNLDAGATVSAKVYDMGGDFVRTLLNNSFRSAGSSSVFWNGTTDNGTVVATGVYFIHIEASGNGGGTSTVVKIAVVEK